MGTELEGGIRTTSASSVEPGFGPMPVACPPTGHDRHRLRRDRGKWGLSLLIAAWVGLVGATCWAMFAYDFEREPGGSGRMVACWPAGSQIATVPGRPTLLMFLHPKCPCSRASLAELDRIWVLHNDQNKLSPHLVIVATVPPDEPSDWLSTWTMQRSQEISGATMYVDRGGHEAQRFGATTSGTVMWFDADGQCRYAGGITSSRGHEGGNIGRDSVEQLLRGETPSETRMPALGCRLCLPEAT